MHEPRTFSLVGTLPTHPFHFRFPVTTCSGQIPVLRSADELSHSIIGMRGTGIKLH